jgi:ribonuclease HII
VNGAGDLLAGVDDATKCPCIGSIMVAGVVADRDIISYWQSIGVKDSKLLLRKRRDELAKEIRRTALTRSVRPILPAVIDDKTLNLNAWEMVTVLQIVQSLRQRINFERILVDNFEVTAANFQQRLRSVLTADSIAFLKGRQIRLQPRLLQRLTFFPEHHADENHVIVGAASILARAASDREYDRHRKVYGDFGSGSPGDPATRMFVWRHRHAAVPIIRTSWGTFKTLALLEDILDDPLCARKLKRLAG